MELCQISCMCMQCIQAKVHRTLVEMGNFAVHKVKECHENVSKNYVSSGSNDRGSFHFSSVCSHCNAQYNTIMVL